MLYENITCPICGHKTGHQLESHPADEELYYSCDNCGSDHDGKGEIITFSDWILIEEIRNEYETENEDSIFNAVPDFYNQFDIED